jgi:hypothetical protein
MSLPALITPAILDKILGNLALLFLTSTGSDLPAARHSASRLLAAYDVETEEELRLAADIVSFGFHALDALGQAMAPNLPLKEVLNLRSSAVNLNRQSYRSQRKLDQLKRDRLAAASMSQESPSPSNAGLPDDGQADIDQAAGLIAFAGEALAASGKAGGVQSWALSSKQRRAARRIAENLFRNQAEQIRRDATPLATDPLLAATSAPSRLANLAHSPGLQT